MSNFILENQRKLSDAAFIAATALPATNASTSTAAFNLIQSFCNSEHYAVQVDIDPLPNFGTAGVLSVVIQDSADNVTFANIPQLGATTITANTAAVTSDQFRLPPTVRPFIKAAAYAPNINGNITAANVTVSLRF